MDNALIALRSRHAQFFEMWRPTGRRGSHTRDLAERPDTAHGRGGNLAGVRFAVSFPPLPDYIRS